MNPITDEQFQKITLLDKLFGSVSVDQLKEFLESEQIVARLKGIEDNPHILLNLVHDRDILMADNSQNKNDIVELKHDVKELVKALNQLYSIPYNSELQNLKSRHGVY